MISSKSLQKAKRYALSAKQIFNLTHKHCNIFLYEELKDMKSIDYLITNHNRKAGKRGMEGVQPPSYLPCILLYPIDKNMGHWTSIIRVDNDKIEFFDPFSIKPDDQLQFSYKKVPPYLSKLISRSNYDIVQTSTIQLQKLDRNINTCGRWVVMRVICWIDYKITLSKFIKVFNQFTGGNKGRKENVDISTRNILKKYKLNLDITSDDLITYLTPL